MAKELGEKHIVLELDSFRVKGHDPMITAYCVTEDLSVQSLMRAEEMKSLHTGLMRNYRKQNWNYCLQALDHLRGQWDGQLDSFYDEMTNRISQLQSSDLDPTWDGTIDRT